MIDHPTRVVFCRSNPIMPDPRVEKESRALARAGYHVGVVGWDRTARLSPIETREGYTIHRIAIEAEYGTGLANLPNLIKWQLGLWHWFRQNHDSYDLIHACDFDTVLPALLARRLWKKPVIYDIFDFYADHLRKTPRWIKRLIRKADISAINQADALILCDDARIEQVRGSRPRSTTVVYNSPEDEGVSDHKPSSKGQLRLAFIGRIMVERMLFEMLDVLEKHPEWQLDLGGYGGDEAQVVERVQNMPNVTWHGRIPYDRTMELSRSADVLFALYDPKIPNHRYSSPNKIFEAMMLAKPVLVAENTNMDRIVQSADAGLVIPYGDTTALEQALAQLADDPSLRERLGRNARKAYEEQYSWTIMEKRLVDLHQEISSK